MKCAKGTSKNTRHYSQVMMLNLGLQVISKNRPEAIIKNKIMKSKQKIYLKLFHFQFLKIVSRQKIFELVMILNPKSLFSQKKELYFHFNQAKTKIKKSFSKNRSKRKTIKMTAKSQKHK